MGSITEKNMKINFGKLLLLGICADIHPILKEAGLAIHGGVILYSEEMRGADALIQQLKRIGVIFCRTWKEVPRAEATLNFKIYAHALRRNEDADKILDFLETDEALMAVVAFGILPEYLAFDCVPNRIVFQASEQEMSAIGDVSRILQGFCNFVHEKPAWLIQELQKFKTSKSFGEIQGDYFLASLSASASCFAAYFRESHDEAETELIQSWLELSIRQVKEWQGEELDNLPAVVRRAVEAYITASDIEICDLDNVDGRVQNALEAGRAVLYDSQFYYLPEDLLKASCEGIVGTNSLLAIKQRLYREGIIQSNSAQSGNYTVKLHYTNVFGAPCRKRFLKFRRQFFVAPGALALEERRRNKDADLPRQIEVQ